MLCSPTLWPFARMMTRWPLTIVRSTWPVRGRKYVDPLRERLQNRKTQQDHRLKLLREAHELLLAGRHDRMLDGQSPFELRGHELRDLVARLRG